MGWWVTRLLLLPFVALGVALIVDMQVLVYRTVEGTVLSKFVREDGCGARYRPGDRNYGCFFVGLIDAVSPILVLTRQQSLEVSQHLYPLIVPGDRLTISRSRLFGAVGHAVILRGGNSVTEFRNAAPRTLTIVGAVLLLPMLLFLVKGRTRQTVVEDERLTLQELEMYREDRNGNMGRRELRSRAAVRRMLRRRPRRTGRRS